VEPVTALWIVCSDVVEEVHGKASLVIAVMADGWE
jgi:hypothetical protein